MVAALLLSIIRISPSMEEEELNVAQTVYLVTLRLFIALTHSDHRACGMLISHAK